MLPSGAHVPGSDELNVPLTTPSGSAGGPMKPAVAPPRAARQSVRLDFLAGIRAVAMLIVLAFHALTVGPTTAPQSLTLSLLHRYALHGQVGVVVFIVLSGYCLMMPVAQSDDGTLRGGVRGFFRRRALRVLPAYYAALLASVVLAWAATRLHSAAGAGGDFSADLSLRNIGTHLLLLHNVWFDTAFTINGAMWSVATEWQIYVVFVLLLLPLWRRFGVLTALLVGFVLGILPALLLPINQSYYWARPWYLGLFALGMATAALQFSHRPTLFGPAAERIPFGWLFAISASIALAIHILWGLSPSWPVDTLEGFCAVSLIGMCAQSCARAGPTPGLSTGLVRMLERPWLLYLADISYSVYLLQHIVFKGIATFAGKLHASADAVVTVNFLVGVPVALAAAHVFARYFERPFVSRRASGARMPPPGGSRPDGVYFSHGKPGAA
jgi:peptidoglycan/LPS O-acetylase OafA/YrhL